MNPKDMYVRSSYIRALMEQKKKNTAVNSGLQTAEPQQVSIPEQIPEAEKKRNGWERTWDTVDEFVSNLGEGVLGFLDGINDAVAYAYGGISGDQSGAKDWMNYDWQAPVQSTINLTSPSKLLTGDVFTDEYWNEWGDIGSVEESRANINKLHENSWTRDWFGEEGQQTYNSITQGIGSAIPSIVLGIVSGGSSIAAQAAIYGAMGVSAFGNASATALNEGASYGKAGLYGAVNAGIEILTEKAIGGLNGVKIGVKGSRKALKEASEEGFKAIAKATIKDMVGEGLEEVIVELADPLAKTIYKGSEALERYRDPELFGDLLTSFAGGALGALAGGGIQKQYIKSKFSAQGAEVIELANSINDVKNEYVENLSSGANEVELSQEYGQVYSDLVKTFADKLANLKRTNLKQFRNVVEALYGQKMDTNATVTDMEGKLQEVVSAKSESLTQQYLNDIRSKFPQLKKGNMKIVSHELLQTPEGLEKLLGRKVNQNTVEQFKRINNEVDALKIGDQYFISDTREKHINQYVVHEGISHGILDIDKKIRDELMSSFKLNRNFMEKLKSIDEEIYQKYGLKKAEVSKLFKQTADAEEFNSEKMALFVEFLYSDNNIAPLLNSLNRSRISKILNKALSFLKGKGDDTLQAQREIEKAIQKITKKQNVELQQNAELQSEQVSRYNKDGTRFSLKKPFFEDYNEERVYNEEIRKRQARPKAYDETGKQTIYTANNVFIVNPYNNYSFLRQYTSDEYYDLTHEGETGYDKTKNDFDNGIGKNHGQKTGVRTIRTDSVGKERTENDRLLEGKTKNNQGSLQKDDRINGIEDSPNKVDFSLSNTSKIDKTTTNATEKTETETKQNGIDTNKTIDVIVGRDGRTIKSIKGVASTYERMSNTSSLIGERTLETEAKNIKSIYDDLEKSNDTKKDEKLKTVSAYAQALDNLIKEKNLKLDFGLDEYYNKELREERKAERKKKEAEEKAKAKVERETEAKKEAEKIKNPKPKVDEEAVKKLNQSPRTPKPKVVEQSKTQQKPKKIKILKLNDKVDLRNYIDTLGYKEINEYAEDFGTVEDKLDNIESKRSNNEITCDLMQAYIENVRNDVLELFEKILSRVNPKNKTHSINVLKILYNKYNEIAKRFLSKENDIFKGRKLLEKDIEAGDTAKDFFNDVLQIMIERKGYIKNKIAELQRDNLENTVKEVKTDGFTENTGNVNEKESDESSKHSAEKREIISQGNESAEISSESSVVQPELPKTSGTIDTSSYYGFSRDSNRTRETSSGRRTTETMDGRGTDGGLHGLRGLETEETTTNVVETPSQTNDVAQEATFSDETICNTTVVEKVVVKETRVIIQNTRRVATRTVNSVKAEANFYNKKVYDVVNDAKPLREKLTKYLKERHGQAFVTDGLGTNQTDFEVLCVMDSVDNNLTTDKRVDKIYDIYAQFIKPDKNITNYFKREIRKALENGGKKSKMAEMVELFEAKNQKNIERISIEANKLLDKLTTANEEIEIYKATVKNLESEIKRLTDENTANDKQTAKEIKALKKQLTEIERKLELKKERYAGVKTQVKELKQEILDKKKELNTKSAEIRRLEAQVKAEQQKTAKAQEETSKAKTETAKAKTEVYGKKVVDKEFRKALDISDSLKGFQVVGKGQLSDKAYEEIAISLSKGRIKSAVTKYLEYVGNIQVIVDGKIQTLKDSSPEWKDFEEQMSKVFEEYYKTAKTSKSEEIRLQNKALAEATVGVIKASYTIKNKLAKKGGVAQPILTLTRNLVKGIGSPSITSMRSGAYRKVLKEAYQALTVKDKDGLSIPQRLNYEFDADILDKMNKIGNATGRIKTQEAYDIMTIIRYFSTYLSKSSGAMLYDGKTVKSYAVEGIKQQKVVGKTKWNPMLSAVSPKVVFGYMDSYQEGGVNQFIYNKLLDGEVVEQQSYLELFGLLNDFYKSDAGKEIKKVKNKEVSLKVEGMEHEITGTVGQLMSLHKLLKRDDARKHILKSGIAIRDKKGKVNQRHFTDVTLANLETALENQFKFSDENSIYKKYLDVTTKFFELAKEYKINTDVALKGFSNVLANEDYFPIKVVAYDRVLSLGENADFMSRGMAGSRNYSFNASVEGVRGMLEISDINDVMNVYGNQMAKYRAYAETIDMINMIFNYQLQSSDITDGLYVGETMRNTMTAQFGVNKRGQSHVIEYYNKLLRDVQGIRSYNDGWFEKLRGRFATYQLGANLKVMANQLSALPTALKYIKPQFIAKALGTTGSLGLNIKTKDMPVTAQYRINNHLALTSNTLSDKVGKFASIFGKGMEFTDNLVIKTIWKASLLQCNGDVDKATALFNKVLRETQGFNTLQRSQLLRSENSLIKSMMMFTIQPSHNLSNIMEYYFHWRASKKTGVKISKEQHAIYRRAIIGIAIEGAMYTAIALAFKRLLGKDEDDEYTLTNILESYFNDNIMGMIPFLNSLSFDFDRSSGHFLQINDFNVGAISQVYEAFQEIQNIFTAENPEEKFKSLMYAIGMLTGVPTRNMNNYTTMIMKAFIPETAYSWEINSNGYSVKNKEAINKALDNNQSKKAYTYYKTYTTNIIELNDNTIDIMFDLYKEGYRDIYIKQMPNYIEKDGKTVAVDYDLFKKTYSKLAKPLNRLVTSAKFRTLKGGVQEQVFTKLMNIYYNIARKEQSGEDLSYIEELVKAGYDISKDIIRLVEISNLKSTDKLTRKEVVQKYINKLPISRNEKFLLFFLAGYKIPEEKQRIVLSLLSTRGISYQKAKKILQNA